MAALKRVSHINETENGGDYCFKMVTSLFNLCCKQMCFQTTKLELRHLKILERKLPDNLYELETLRLH